MRTTITLDDRLLRAAKRVAVDRGVTLSTVIEEALRAQLLAKPARDVPAFRLITFRGDGPKPGIDLDRTSSLDEIDDISEYGDADR